MLRKILLALALGSAFLGNAIASTEAADTAKIRALAEQGHATAQFNLGVRYARGKGVATRYIEQYQQSGI